MSVSGGGADGACDASMAGDGPAEALVLQQLAVVAKLPIEGRPPAQALGVSPASGAPLVPAAVADQGGDRVGEGLGVVVGHGQAGAVVDGVFRVVRE